MQFSSPDNRISRKKGTVKRLTICRCERPQFLNDPPSLKKKKTKEREKKKRKKRKIEMNQHQGRKWVGIDGLDVGGGEGRGGKRDNSERMKCKSGNKGNVAEN